MKNLSKDDKIKYWVSHNLKNFTNKGGILQEAELNHIFDWFNSTDASRHINNIEKISIPQAIKLAEKWIQKLNKKSSTIEQEHGIQILMSWPDMYKMVKLVDEQSFKREGKLMNNCVSTYFGLSHSVICSLRDPSNNPVATIELQHSKQTIDLLSKNSAIMDTLFIDKSFTSLFKIKQIKGNSNQKIQQKYKSYISDFFIECYDITNTQIDQETLSFMGFIKYNHKNYTESDLFNISHFYPEKDTKLILSNLDTFSINSNFSGTVAIDSCPNVKNITTNISDSECFSITGCSELKSIKINANNVNYMLIRNNYTIESLELVGYVHCLDLTNLPNLKQLDLSKLTFSELRLHHLSGLTCLDISTLHKLNSIHISSMLYLNSISLNLHCDSISLFSCKELHSISFGSCTSFLIKECEAAQSVSFKNISNSIHIETSPSINNITLINKQLEKIKIIKSNINNIKIIDSKVNHLEINQNSAIRLKGSNSFINSIYSTCDINEIDSTINGNYISATNSESINNFKIKKKNISEKAFNRINYIKTLNPLTIAMIINLISKFSFISVNNKELISFISLLINLPKSSIFIHNENYKDYITIIDQPHSIELTQLYSAFFDIIIISNKSISNVASITYSIFQFIFASLLIIFFVSLTLTIGATFLPLFYIFYKKGFHWLVEELEDFFSEIFFGQSPFR